MTTDDERIALFLDYENLAIGAREALGRPQFDFRPIADALAERGRVVVRRAYADWSNFEPDRRMLTRYQIELIEIPQRMGQVRKNAADIKMAVDAIELSFERDYITTFVLGTGDSDFTPLVHKLRELNRRVIGVGIEASTSALLPPACDEFLFYERLEGVEPAEPRRGTRGARRGAAPSTPEVAESPSSKTQADASSLGELVTQTLAGLERTNSGPVLASMLKRTMLRKDPTFSEADYGFRGFGELLRHLAHTGLVALSERSATGDPEVTFPLHADDEDAAFALLRATVERLAATKAGPPHLSSLKTQLRKAQPDFSEKRFGYSGFLQFAKAADTRGLIEMHYDDSADDYILRPSAVHQQAPERSRGHDG
ncbi:MAG TPA: NYN domain-containing protein [Acidimicrobiia bacterium]|nr:NYN domain-containing protein [Acidimicrobiia bacterium]